MASWLLVPTSWSLRPLHIWAMGHDHVIARALDSRPKAYQLSKALDSNVVCHNAYLLEVGMTICHVEIHFNVLFMVIALGMSTFNFLVWSELERSRPFRPMRGLRMQWSRAFSLMCTSGLWSHGPLAACTKLYSIVTCKRWWYCQHSAFV
jgi:hypothetical protein